LRRAQIASQVSIASLRRLIRIPADHAATQRAALGLR
jgi:hypothetical protein